MRDGTNHPTALLEVRPQREVRLLLVKLHGVCIFVHFVEEEFVGVVVRPEHVCGEQKTLACVRILVTPWAKE